MWSGIFAFVIAAVLGFAFGKRVHLKRVASVLLQVKMPSEEVDKVVYLVSEYPKLQREAKKATKEAYKKSLVSAQLEKIKKEDKENNG